MSNGIGGLPTQQYGGAVPGAPANSAPAAPSPAGPTVDTSNVDELTRQILQGLKQQHEQSVVAYKPIAPAIPAEQQYWKPQMRGPTPGVNSLAHNAAAMLANLGRQSLEKRVQKAEADWETLVTGVQTNNKALLDSILNNPKALKNMSKVFQIDWLAPHKQTPHSIALNRVMHRQNIQDKAKKAGLLATITHVLGLTHGAQAARTPPFLPGQTGETDPQRIMKMLPIAHPAPDFKDLKSLGDLLEKIRSDNRTAQLNAYKAMQQGRYDDARISETERHNKADENLSELGKRLQAAHDITMEKKQDAANRINQARLSETERHNRAIESIDRMKAATTGKDKASQNFQKLVAPQIQSYQRKLGTLNSIYERLKTTRASGNFPLSAVGMGAGPRIDTQTRQIASQRQNLNDAILYLQNATASARTEAEVKKASTVADAIASGKYK